ncbi:MAG: exodeoxyribonuclease VII small subunit [Elusimicrobia bacterium]|nr:exodeoxyribonuclease VII small subunit [Elusimicrobiota bacterium]
MTTNKTVKEKAPQKESFEQSLEQLEGIVRQLESGEKGLEDSLKLFEDGAKLSKQLTARLEDVKQRVEVLVKDGKDKLKARPLEDVDAEA